MIQKLKITIIWHFRGPAHNKCNLNLEDPNFNPIVLHNWTGEDSHLFKKVLCDEKDKTDVIA